MNSARCKSLLFHSPHLTVFHLISLRSDHRHVFFPPGCLPLLRLQMFIPVLGPRLEGPLLPPPDSCSSFCFDCSCRLFLLCAVITEHPHITVPCIFGHVSPLLDSEHFKERRSVSDLSLYLQHKAWSFVQLDSQCLLQD